MTGKEYLEQVEKFEYKIKCMKLRSEEYDRLSFSIPSCQFDAIRVDGTRNLEAPFMKWILKKIDLDDKIEVYEKKLDDLKGEVMLKIEELEDEQSKNILILKYIQYKPLDEIGSKLYVSFATVKRWHVKAINEFEELYKKLSQDEPK